MRQAVYVTCGCTLYLCGRVCQPPAGTDCRAVGGTAATLLYYGYIYIADQDYNWDYNLIQITL